MAPSGVEVTIVEPGGIRTGWAAVAAEPSGPITLDYEQTVGLWLARFAEYASNEPGDRDRRARAILGAVNAEEPTVFADVDNSMRIAQEEIFGPSWSSSPTTMTTPSASPTTPSAASPAASGPLIPTGP